MKRSSSVIRAACLAAGLCVATAAVAQAPAAGPKGEVVASSAGSATVEAVDHATRELTLKTSDGQLHSYIVGPEVKNFAQIRKGDAVKVEYTEALAYELKKGGGPLGMEVKAGAKAAEPGAKPSATFERRIKATVKVTAIDPSVPSVTFTGPEGRSQTVKVMHPEKLEGVKVGDNVELTYTQAMAIKVEEAAKK